MITEPTSQFEEEYFNFHSKYSLSSRSRMNAIAAFIDAGVPTLGTLEEYALLRGGKQCVVDDVFLAEHRTLNVGLGRQSGGGFLIRKNVDPDNDIVIAMDDSAGGMLIDEVVNQSREDGKKVRILTMDKVRFFFTENDQNKQTFKRVWIIYNKGRLASSKQKLYLWLSEQNIDENIVIINFV